MCRWESGRDGLIAYSWTAGGGEEGEAGDVRCGGTDVIM